MKSKITLQDKVFEPYIFEDAIQEAVLKIADQINQDYNGKKPLFVCVLNGSFMFTSDLLKAIEIENEVCFVKLSSYNGIKSTGVVNELIGLPNSVENREIVILEDIVDTGNTLEKLYKLFDNYNVKSLSIATLLFKNTVYKKKYPINYYGIKIPNTFVVGFGLDYNELGRHLRRIYKLTDN